MLHFDLIERHGLALHAYNMHGYAAALALATNDAEGAAGHLDAMKVNVELKPEFQFASAPEKEFVAHDLQRHIKSYIGITARIDIVDTDGIERSIGKARRVIDRRPG